VGQVRLFGSSDYAMRIWVKPDVLAKLGLAVPDLTKAIQQQSTVNPSGQVGAAPAPKGVEKTYTVLAQDGSRRRRSSARSSSAQPGRLRRALAGRRPHRTGRPQLSAAVAHERAARSIIAVYQSPGSNALAVANALNARSRTSKAGSPLTSTTPSRSTRRCR